MQKITNALHRAVLEYDLIQNGDKVAIGLSGGKDSLALLYTLSNYRKFKGVQFDLCAITIDLSNGSTDFSTLEQICASLDVPFYVVKTNIFEVVFDIRKESNPCSLCAKMRRGSLNSKAKELQCNKVALAHHKDDMIETFFLSLLYEGRLSSFLPKTYLSNVDLEVIRPLIHVDESTIIGAVTKLNLPILHNPCIANKHTQREEMKKLIAQLNTTYPQSKELMYAAITHPERINLPGIEQIETNIHRKQRHN